MSCRTSSNGAARTNADPEAELHHLNFELTIEPAVGSHFVGVWFTLGADCNLEAVACAREAIRCWRDHT